MPRVPSTLTRHDLPPSRIGASQPAKPRSGPKWARSGPPWPCPSRALPAADAPRRVATQDRAGLLPGDAGPPWKRAGAAQDQIEPGRAQIWAAPPWPHAPAEPRRITPPPHAASWILQPAWSRPATTGRHAAAGGPRRRAPRPARRLGRSCRPVLRAPREGEKGPRRRQRPAFIQRRPPAAASGGRGVWKVPGGGGAGSLPSPTGATRTGVNSVDEMLEIYEKLLKQIDNGARFLSDVLSGDINCINGKKSELRQELMEKGFDPLPKEENAERPDVDAKINSQVSGAAPRRQHKRTATECLESCPRSLQEIIHCTFLLVQPALLLIKHIFHGIQSLSCSDIIECGVGRTLKDSSSSSVAVYFLGFTPGQSDVIHELLQNFDECHLLTS